VHRRDGTALIRHSLHIGSAPSPRGGWRATWRAPRQQVSSSPHSSQSPFVCRSPLSPSASTHTLCASPVADRRRIRIRLRIRRSRAKQPTARMRRTRPWHSGSIGRGGGGRRRRAHTANKGARKQRARHADKGTDGERWCTRAAEAAARRKKRRDCVAGQNMAKQSPELRQSGCQIKRNTPNLNIKLKINIK
jgi:hypothetical protein